MNSYRLFTAGIIIKKKSELLYIFSASLKNKKLLTVNFQFIARFNRTNQCRYWDRSVLF